MGNMNNSGVDIGNRGRRRIAMTGKDWRSRVAFIVGVVVICLGVLGLREVRAVDLEMAPIRYWDGELNDPFAKLQRRVESGEVSLKSGSTRGVVMKLLEALSIPVESQVMVYSKTSAQNSRIYPKWPRAIYYSDDAYVGWVQGGAVEVLTFDPERGAIFYLLDPGVSPGEREPQWSRPQTCLNCHGTTPSSGVPGGLVRSVFPGRDGMPFFQMGTFATDDTSPLENRWGGWYVTGKPGGHRHMGNALAVEEKEGIELVPMVRNAEYLLDLSEVIDTTPYPAGGSSDIVALMVMEHQIRLHNILNHANLSVRQLDHRTREMYENLGEPIPDEPTGALKRVIASQAEKIVKALLFTDEFPLKGDGVEGNNAFRNAFLRTRRPSEDDRSLKDFRLYERIFKYRCSYVIYSDVFRSLPELVKSEVFRLLHTGLKARNGTGLTGHLSTSERARIFRILGETHPDIPEYWH